MIPHDLETANLFLRRVFRDFCPAVSECITLTRGVDRVAAHLDTIPIDASQAHRQLIRSEIYYKINPQRSRDWDPYHTGGAHEVSSVHQYCLDVDTSIKGPEYAPLDFSIDRLFKGANEAGLPEPSYVVLANRVGSLHVGWLRSVPLCFPPIYDCVLYERHKQGNGSFLAKIRKLLAPYKVDERNQGLERVLRLPGTYRSNGNQVIVYEDLSSWVRYDESVFYDINEVHVAPKLASNGTYELSANVREYIQSATGCSTPSELLTMFFGWSQHGKILTRPASSGERPTLKSAEDRTEYVKVYSNSSAVIRSRDRGYGLDEVYAAYLNRERLAAMEQDQYEATLAECVKEVHRAARGLAHSRRKGG